MGDWQDVMSMKGDYAPWDSKGWGRDDPDEPYGDAFKFWRSITALDRCSAHELHAESSATGIFIERSWSDRDLPNNSTFFRSTKFASPQPSFIQLDIPGRWVTWGYDEVSESPPADEDRGLLIRYVINPCLFDHTIANFVKSQEVVALLLIIISGSTVGTGPDGRRNSMNSEARAADRELHLLVENSLRHSEITLLTKAVVPSLDAYTCGVGWELGTQYFLTRLLKLGYLPDGFDTLRELNQCWRESLLAKQPAPDAELPEDDWDIPI